MSTHIDLRIGMKNDHPLERMLTVRGSTRRAGDLTDNIDEVRYVLLFKLPMICLLKILACVASATGYDNTS